MTQEQVEDVQDAAPVSASVPVDMGGYDPLRVVEAMLFASAAPLSINAIRDRMPEGVDVGGMLMDLQKTYEGRGVRLVEMDGTWAFRTDPALSDALEVTRDVQRKLSRAAMETLAIVAYHQPLTRAEIENIRGVATNKGTLDVLMEQGWVRPGRRREAPGRPVTWVTTPAFMDHFGLESLNDLPGMDDLKAAGLLDRRPAIETLSATGLLFSEDDVSSSDEAAQAAEQDEAAQEFVPAELAGRSDDDDGDMADVAEMEDMN